jgi:DNA-binding NtrC family response regulator
MPVMDGLEFLNSLRQLDATVPVIVLTAYGAVESYLKSLSLGVFDYINKPIKAKELGRIVQAAIDSSKRNAVDMSPKRTAM